MDRGAWRANIMELEELGMTEWLNTHIHIKWYLWQRPRGRVTIALCGLRGQKGWIPRQENQNAILDALIQNLGSTLLQFKKKKKKKNF